ncbi:hypothetical protein SAMN05444349_11878 [Bacteroides faecichinchillae]|uniref:Phage portal protein, PBSX family n=1 Tax=Bacteroides faecichinchillae TaxID=871325 RepID=A0A1M5BDI7_9BACE|nr:hypothetical protein [Bacteroides faecichinchillae]SHF40574.1 hypothetical protein SAMN05444349_11878 [Bacteroides faecichinchillae]
MAESRKVTVLIDKPVKTRPFVSEKIVGYGDSNLYPQLLSNMIYASKSASSSVERLSEAIECEGFLYDSIGEIKNDHGESLNDILNIISYDIARFRGCALIVQYGGNFRPRAVYPVPFEYVRAGLNKDYLKDSRVYNWVVFDNWDRDPYKYTQVQGNSITYPTFNPKKFREECETYGGIENHPGQLMYMNFFTTRPYPLSPFHSVQNEMIAESQNGEYVYRVLGRGFHCCNIVTHGAFQETAEQDSFAKGIANIMGAQGAGSTVLVRDDNVISDKPFIRVDKLGTPIEADLYKAYNEPLKKDIAMQAYNIPIPLIDSSLIAFSNASGEVIKEMQKIYRRSTAKLRNKISRDLSYIFDTEPAYFEIKNDLEDKNYDI